MVELPKPRTGSFRKANEIVTRNEPLVENGLDLLSEHNRSILGTPSRSAIVRWCASALSLGDDDYIQAYYELYFELVGRIQRAHQNPRNEAIHDEAMASHDKLLGLHLAGSHRQ